VPAYDPAPYSLLHVDGVEQFVDWCATGQLQGRLVEDVDR
jgi:hypothetical protein